MTDFNASDRKSIRSAEKAAALRTIQDREAVAAIMSTIPGRAWMWRKLSEAGIFKCVFTGDALREAFNSGERNFGLRLLDDIIAHCPDAYLQMIKESNNDRHDDSTGRTEPDAYPDSIAQRPSRPLADGGDSGSDSESAEGPEFSDLEERNVDYARGGWRLVQDVEGR